MADPGLSNRLRQHSRRAGLMVGVSMALTIAICVGGFAAFYAGLAPLLSDVIGAEAEPTPQPTRVPAPAVSQAEAPAETPAAAPQVAAAAEVPTAAPTAAPTEAAEPTPTAETFQGTHEIRTDTGQSINLRPNPSTDNTPIRALSPGTPLQYLGEDARSSVDGRWMRFRTEENEEGWVREVDVVELEGDQ